ncbi:chromosome partitioning protein ParA [Burkholderia sp. HI2714]|nr:chromosome partitioning protein ParA [Burkholderia sp. HI2714]
MPCALMLSIAEPALLLIVVEPSLLYVTYDGAEIVPVVGS